MRKSVAFALLFGAPGFAHEKETFNPRAVVMGVHASGQTYDVADVDQVTCDNSIINFVCSSRHLIYQALPEDLITSGPKVPGDSTETVTDTGLVAQRLMDQGVDYFN